MSSAAEIKAWEAAALANPYVEPTPEEQAAQLAAEQPAPIKERPQVRPPRDGRLLRMSAWCIAAIDKPTLTAAVVAVVLFFPRLLMKGFGTSLQPGPLRVWASGVVSAEEKAARDKHCNECSMAFVRAKAGGEIVAGLYCGSCGCGEWWGSELKRKNWYAKWVCPRGKHGTKRPETEWRESLPEDMRSLVSLTVNGHRQTACGQRGA